tara:strand:+ start:1307 stop:1867 length:561 start_codon:yes stop_codon:yes gene_type:complete
LNENNLNNLLQTKKLFLVGFMATGKTTIGKKLSSKLKMPFLDSDKEIELSYNMKVIDIFKTHGEKKFREIEEKIITDKINSSKYNGFIMSLGGGAYLNNNINKAIDAVGISIWLNAQIETIEKRIKQSKTQRPLVLKFNSRDKLEKLMKDRIRHYEKAKIKVNVFNTSKENMTNIILKKIYTHITN